MTSPKVRAGSSSSRAASHSGPPTENGSPSVAPFHGRRAVLLAATAGVLSGLAANLATLPHREEGRGGHPSGVQVFHVPHQDDEVLTLGAPLLEAVASGDEVHCVLLTRGSGSGARTRLVEQGWLSSHVEVFVAARIREFRAAVTILGLPWDHVHLRNAPDPSPPGRIAREVDWGVQNWPGALHHTMSWRDPHPDHQSAGLALNERWTHDRDLDVRFWQYPIHRHRFPIGATELPVSDRIADAAAEYGVWDPTLSPPERSISHEPYVGGRYAIGWRSARDGFEGMDSSRSGWFRGHGPRREPVPPAARVGPGPWRGLVRDGFTVQG